MSSKLPKAIQPVQGDARSLFEILKGKKYSIDYYQREYKWESKQILELVGDLTTRFLETYESDHARKDVEKYPHYFLGSIIVSSKDGAQYVVDGQQRLTSITLLLIHLHLAAQGRDDVDPFSELIYSTKFGAKSFNLDVPDREPCMTALFEGTPFDPSTHSESVQNLVGRFEDIQGAFPDEVTEHALPYFIDWLMHNVRMVEITAFTDDDAYGIFETMNDRGLKLTPADMLKGYLLANITDEGDRHAANELWRSRVRQLTEIEADTDSDFLKAWLRSQYSQRIRERKRGAIPQDWDRIGTEFHRWLRENSSAVGLESSADFKSFLTSDFDFYSKCYVRALAAASAATPEPGLEFIQYNSDRAFTLQYQSLLAPLEPGDPPETVARKMELVARFIDITLARRIWNYKSIAYSTMSYAMFLAMRSVRRKPVEEVARTLHAALGEQAETFATNDRLRVHQQNRFQIHRTLARITNFVGVESGEPDRYRELVGATGVKHEVEHIWADKFTEHADEFKHEHDFSEQRNRIGDLLIVPKSFNAAYGAAAYEEKRPHYLSQNLLARSLHEQAYEKSPGFVKFVARHRLDFRPHQEFKSADIEARSALYRQLSDLVWNPDDLLRVAGLREVDEDTEDVR